MRGVVFLGDRELELREFPDPTPEEGEVVLEMKASGMCGSDLHPYRAPRQGATSASSLGLGGKGGPVIAGLSSRPGSFIARFRGPAGERRRSRSGRVDMMGLVDKNWKQ